MILLEGYMPEIMSLLMIVMWGASKKSSYMIACGLFTIASVINGLG